MILNKCSALIAGLAILALPLLAAAQDDSIGRTARELRASYDKALQRKTLAYLPIALGTPLPDEWGRVVQEEAEWRGMNFIVRNPDNSLSAMRQALAALLDEKPDVMIVQNPNAALLTEDLKRAESLGTHVIQLNLSSNYKSGAFVGVDWHEVGRMLATEVVHECGTGTGRSGKVQIVQGEMADDAGVDQVSGMMEILDRDPAIRVVSNQAAHWDASTALKLTTAVIQQHPDLCASVGFWGIMQSGAAQAIREAGKLEAVRIYASGEGSQLDCDQVNLGNFLKFLSYKATEQGHDVVLAAQTLLESGEKPGTRNLEYYTRPIWLDKSNASGGNCFELPRRRPKAS